jgi:hypothetical protein
MKTLCKQSVADDLLALCYIAELEDGGRGIRKLLKGVKIEGTVSFDMLTRAAQDSLFEGAGLIDRSMDAADGGEGAGSVGR